MKLSSKKYNSIKIIALMLSSLFLFSCEVEEDANSAPDISVNVTEADIVGIWRRTETDSVYKGKEYLAGGTGWLGNYNSGPFTRANPFTWALVASASGYTLVEYRDFNAATYNEDITELTVTSMVLLRQEDGVSRYFAKQ
ncbi:MAG: hypothetical protein OEY36_04650 [Gammaproteobacteria bacterium]|nr:hypothetical protein [Gammaproteobacteria bacterium]